MTPTFSLNLPSGSSHVVIQSGVLQESQTIDFFYQISHNCVVVTDDTTKALYGETLKHKIEQKGGRVALFSIPGGELSKTRFWKEYVEDSMLQAHYGRDTLILALGGGVVTDLAGFVAATYCRGVPWMALPTTLLGQVDASLGGKVGLNTPYGKNMIGAFYHPSWVWVDPSTLHTLPEDEKRYGMAEVIKYALIASYDLFMQLNQGGDEVTWIQASCRIKKEIVEHDPEEHGLRRILNFGHTVGHALEKVTDYGIPHGEAVACGMLVEAYLSVCLGYLSHYDYEKIKTILKKYAFSLSWPTSVTTEALITAMSHDKKAQAKRPRFVILKTIGSVLTCGGEYCLEVNSKLIEEALQL